MLPVVGFFFPLESQVSRFFFHSRVKSQDFFSTRESSLKIFFPLESQVSRSSSYTSRASYVVFVYRLWHSILSTSTCVGIVGVRSKRSRTVPQAVWSILTPCHTLFICVDSQAQGKTRRFASVTEVQCRAFTNWTNWSTWHVECDRLISRGGCALATAWSFHSLGL